MSTCTYAGRKDEPAPRLLQRGEQGKFPCFRKGTVTVVENATRGGNPFRERLVCRVHANEMIADGFYFEITPRAAVSQERP